MLAEIQEGDFFKVRPKRKREGYHSEEACCSLRTRVEGPNILMWCARAGTSYLDVPQWACRRASEPDNVDDDGAPRQRHSASSFCIARAHTI